MGNHKRARVQKMPTFQAPYISDPNSYLRGISFPSNSLLYIKYHRLSGLKTGIYLLQF